MTATATPRIVVFGDVCLHVTVRPSGPDEFGRGDVELSPGGSGAMVALQVAALRRAVTMVGVAGDDDIGADLRGRLAASGVDCPQWTYVTGPTARVAVLVGPGGDHRVVVAQGGVTEPGKALAAAMGQVSTSDSALCYVPGFPAYDEARTGLTERRARVICDFGFRPWLTDPGTAAEHILGRIDGVTVAVCSGGAFSEADNRALAGACLDRGVSVVVTTLGSGGCLVTDADGTAPVAGFAAEPVNTLGAGDSLVAGLLVGLADGLPPARACLFAQAVAATKIGTLSSPAAPDAVRALLATVGWTE